MWAIWDSGIGNLHSLRKALQAAGAVVGVTRDATVLAQADVAVLPGVGSFGAFMEALGPAVDVLRQRHAAGRPIVGICIGMQALYAGSEEAPGKPGLGILSQTVQRLPASAGKVPHMGWNTVTQGGVVEAGHVYYVHSYAAPVGPETVATSNYGMEFSAAVRIGRTLGFQFHPEKSGAMGLRVLRRTVAWGNA